MENSVAHQRVQLDEAFVTVPLDAGEEASVRLSLVVRKESDPADGSFCRLRQLTDANIYLGCFTDRSGHILKWLELWVRNYDNIADKLHENAFDVINNSVLDERWERQKKILELSEASHVYKTSLDTEMEYSLHVDVYNKKVGFVKDATSKTHWKICKEDDFSSVLNWRLTAQAFIVICTLRAWALSLTFYPLRQMLLRMQKPSLLKRELAVAVLCFLSILTVAQLSYVR